jgi:hypothetical protein
MPVRKLPRIRAVRNGRPASSISVAQRPNVGMLVWPSRTTRLGEGSAAPSIRLAAEAARLVGVNLYFFSVRDVDPGTRRVQGWQQRPDGSWAKTTMPWPDVFHPAAELKSKQGQLVKAAMLQQCLTINSHDVLGKWEVHRALESFPEMQRYLPETLLYSQPTDLETMLDLHRTVLAKLGYGLGAINISKVWRLESGQYGWEDSSSGTRLMHLSFSEMLGKVMENANGPFVVQQELGILERGGRRNKIRALMNKDGSGEWRQSLSYLFVGSPGQFAVSRHQGAKQLPLTQGLRAMGIRGQLARRISYQLNEAATLTVKCLDGALGPMGEIGLDLALGNDGRVWLIERTHGLTKICCPLDGGLRC